MRIRTSNNNRSKAVFRRTYAEAFAFHEARVAKLRAANRLGKLRYSGYMKRHF